MEHRRSLRHSRPLRAELYRPFSLCWEFNGHSGVREVIEDVRRAFSGWTETVQDIIVEGDKVVWRYVSTGVHDGLFRGQAPTGERIVMDEISIFRFEGPRIAEQWCVTSRRPGRSAL